jgi:GNAT superfamily N-acetyltransferase
MTGPGTKPRTPSANADAYRRAWAFELAVHERMSTRVERFTHGVACFNETYPRSYDHNAAWVSSPIPGVSAEELAGEVDELQGAAGCRHRQILLFDEADGERLRGGFEGLGWKLAYHLCMAFRGDEAPAPPSVAVEEIGWEEFRPAVRTIVAREPYADSEETIRQLTERKGLRLEAARARFFVARVDGQIASVCDLYSDGRAAQVEEVDTLEEFRRRGLARAVVSHAVRVALEEDHDLVFLYADDDDWPREFYARVGFQPAGRSPILVKDPPGSRRATGAR